MRHDPASAALVIMLKSLKMTGMAEAISELTEQGSPAFQAAVPVLSQSLKTETAERETRDLSGLRAADDFAQNLKIGAVFTLGSLARSFALRRLFEANRARLR